VKLPVDTLYQHSLLNTLMTQP